MFVFVALAQAISRNGQQALQEAVWKRRGNKTAAANGKPATKAKPGPKAGAASSCVEGIKDADAMFKEGMPSSPG